MIAPAAAPAVPAASAADAPVRILIVEDEAMVARVMSRALEEVGIAADVVSSAAAAREAVAQPVRHDGVLLDLQLPDESGLAFLEELRAQRPGLPVLIVTGQRADTDIVRGLDAGADDYLVKPFAVGVLIARVRALLRRGGSAAAESRTVGELRLDRLKREVVGPHGPLLLTPKEYTLLEYLLLRPNTVLSRAALLADVWGMNFDPHSNLVDVHVARLRRKLQQAVRNPRLRTERGAGYSLVTLADAAEGDRFDDAADAGTAS